MHEPYQVQLNGYQNGCDGCFAPFAYNQPLDSRFGNVNEFRTGAGSHYAGLQTSVTKQFAGLTLRGNYSFSHCLDEVSNGGLLAFSSLGILSPLPGDLSKEYGNCDYDVRHNLSAFAIYEIPFHSSHALLRQTLGGWQVSGTAILHSGVAVQRSQRALYREQQWHLPGQRAAVCESGSGCAAVPQDAVSGVTQPGSLQWLNPDAFASVVDPARGHVWAAIRLRTASSATPAATTSRTALHLLRGLRHEEDSDHGTCDLPLRHANIQSLQPSELRPPRQAGTPGEPATQTGFGAHQHVFSPTGLLGVGLGGDSSPRMIAFQGRIEF